ncbi:FecCD family ABC transporter permease [Sulfurospirillum barnesii]|uniref:ABC-type Fe3+-siderophore transport system, permease component n=1 Tax=Sulfurospirillum barnesii (strain ATCC 700032 / DSM 10660 / SES-3) TaxID=760154 RepID=I3XZV8_SULBS|nr:iron ABC transporter permease [Sulfurospirillum barnesii]AFL69482.1 ABC-type Fe3+-siderophore transport system, permease component [Sulfurospirillum barnesii SES-3]
MSLQSVYRKRFLKRFFISFGFVGLIVLLLWVALISGSSGVVWSDSVKLLELSKEPDSFRMIIESIRLPRALAALLVGMLLGLSGVAMQGVLHNPLASPFTLGISQAAGFGAAFAIIVLESSTFSNPFISKFSIALCAFLASMLCTALIVWIGKKVHMRPTSIILAGVGLGSLFHSGTMFLQYFTTEINAAAALFWTFGDLSKANHENLLFLTLVFIPALLLLWIGHWKFDALCFGDESAFNKGVHVQRFRSVVFLVSALCTAIAVAFFGIIGFIGLIAPHLIRLLLGGAHSMLIPLSALCGGALLLGADLLARMMLYPSVLPVGILTSFIGAPMLLYLLATQGKLR